MSRLGWRWRLHPGTARADSTATGVKQDDQVGPEACRTTSESPALDSFAAEDLAEQDVEDLIGDTNTRATREDLEATAPGPPLSRQSPFVFGLLAVLGAAVGYGIVMIVVELATIILYIVLALFLALGVDSVIAALVRKGLTRSWAVLVVLTAFLVMVVLLAWLAIPPIADQVASLIDKAPDYVADVRDTPWVERVNERWNLADRLLQHIQDGVTADTATTIFGGILGAGKAFADGALAVFTVFVLTAYFVVAMPQVKAAAYVLIPRSRRPRVVYLGEQISSRVGRYLLGQLLVATINGMFAYVILLILRLPYPTLLAVLIGLLALVPILGTLVGGTIMTLVALTAGWIPTAVVVVYYLSYHLFETYVISPRVMSRAVEIPPVITIVAVLAGGALLGVVGALLAIPVAAGLSVLYHQVAVPRQQGA